MNNLTREDKHTKKAVGTLLNRSKSDTIFITEHSKLQLILTNKLKQG